MDWEWFYAQTREENERTIAANGGTMLGLDECVYCGRLFTANGSEQCSNCDLADVVMGKGA
jgi:hypothetical protein